MTPELEAEFVALANELLEEFGFPFNAERVDGTYNPATLTNSNTPITYSGFAAFFDPSSSNLNGYEQQLLSDNVKRKWLLARGTLPMATGDKLITAKGTFTVFNLTEVGPENAIIYRIASDKVA